MPLGVLENNHKVSVVEHAQDFTKITQLILEFVLFQMLHHDLYLLPKPQSLYRNGRIVVASLGFIKIPHFASYTLLK